LFYVGPTITIDILWVQNCSFTGGASQSAFYINGSWGAIEWMNNQFIYEQAASPTPMIEFLNTITASSILIAGNKFASNISKTSVKADTIPLSTKLVFKDNYTTNTVQRLRSQHIKLNNIVDGVVSS
jgi:hypothetical protein